MARDFWVVQCWRFVAGPLCTPLWDLWHGCRGGGSLILIVTLVDGDAQIVGWRQEDNGKIQRQVEGVVGPEGHAREAGRGGHGVEKLYISVPMDWWQ